MLGWFSYLTLFWARLMEWSLLWWSAMWEWCVIQRFSDCLCLHHQGWCDETKSKSLYNWRSVSLFVLVSSSRWDSWPDFSRPWVWPLRYLASRGVLSDERAGLSFTSEISVNLYLTTPRNIPKDTHLHTLRRENLISHRIYRCPMSLSTGINCRRNPYIYTILIYTYHRPKHMHNLYNASVSPSIIHQIVPPFYLISLVLFHHLGYLNDRRLDRRLE
jgi:hypothetical protein